MSEENLKFTKDHEWVRIEGEKAFVGLTSYALEELGDVVYLNFKPKGTLIEAHEPLGVIESTKTVSDIYAPLKGTILEVNEDLIQNPKNLSLTSYEENWFVVLRIEEGPTSLLSLEEYKKYLKKD
jgi:glycine cleavage system H protein